MFGLVSTTFTTSRFTLRSIPNERAQTAVMSVSLVTLLPYLVLLLLEMYYGIRIPLSF